jgi:hypothetical protein
MYGLRRLAVGGRCRRDAGGAAVETSEKLEAVLAGIAASEAFQRVSSAAWPSATVKRFS